MMKDIHFFLKKNLFIWRYELWGRYRYPANAILQGCIILSKSNSSQLGWSYLRGSLGNCPVPWLRWLAGRADRKWWWKIKSKCKLHCIYEGTCIVNIRHCTLVQSGLGRKKMGCAGASLSLPMVPTSQRSRFYDCVPHYVHGLLQPQYSSLIFPQYFCLWKTHWKPLGLHKWKIGPAHSLLGCFFPASYSNQDFSLLCRLWLHRNLWNCFRPHPYRWRYVQ